MGRALAILLLCAGCGTSAASADAQLGGADAKPGAAADATPVSTTPDAAESTTLGHLCATTAADGGPGSCNGSVCCNNGGTTVCTLPDDCPTAPGYKACGSGADCQGSICCHVQQMQFCTKTSACTAYGGSQVP